VAVENYRKTRSFGKMPRVLNSCISPV
jgi:hypothetical protein